MENNYKTQLKQKILELQEGIHGMAEVNRNMREETGCLANTYMALSTYANYAKLQILLNLFNRNFYDEEMKALEQEVNECLNEQEDSIAKHILSLS